MDLPRGSSTLDDMVREYEESLTRDPFDASIRNSLALARLYQHNWRAAAQQFRQVIHLEPDFADAYANLAIALSKLGDLQEARRALERARALSPASTRLEVLSRRLAGAPQPA